MTKGKLIVIDGGDGAGKRTQTGLLEDRLRSEGLVVAKFAFPRYEQYFGRMIRQFLNGDFGDPTKIDPKMTSLLYAMDRMQAAPEINGALDSGAVVLCDRYTQSNMAYQAAKIDDETQRIAFLAWLEDLEYNQLEVPRSDLAFYLQTSVAVSQRLIQERAGADATRAVDAHESNVDYQTRVAETYRWLAGRDAHWCLVDCLDGTSQMRLPQEIHREVYERAIEVIRN